MATFSVEERTEQARAISDLREARLFKEQYLRWCVARGDWRLVISSAVELCAIDAELKFRNAD